MTSNALVTSQVFDWQTLLAMLIIYGIHNPVGIKYLTRLRVGLSHLPMHKFHHNTTQGFEICIKRLEQLLDDRF